MSEGINYGPAIESMETSTLREVQKQNLEVMASLPEKYPHAFIRGTDDRGRQYLIVKTYQEIPPNNIHDAPTEKTNYLISQDGYLCVKNSIPQSEFLRDNINLTPVFDNPPLNTVIEVTDKDATKKVGDIRITTREDFQETDLKRVKSILTKAEKEHGDSPNSKKSTKNIIASL